MDLAGTSLESKTGDFQATPTKSKPVIILLGSKRGISVGFSFPILGWRLLRDKLLQTDCVVKVLGAEADLASAKTELALISNTEERCVGACG